ncbi:hypothetical protein [Asaia spathodeae]|uniref:Uncharacterized protein n=1 Tax=Asaia spathodeae TaxID=657016 RepID=A0ABX2P6D0_9PROT|nr:hypothetical protein [Asaia spathodeae]GBR19718.1 hypothetical protein AA105894_2380 [Asaia spathodeae NBRC 105894]
MTQHEQKPESNFTTMRVPSWPDLNPDPFVFVIVGRGRMSFYKDGRVVADFVEPDEAAKDFVKSIEDHYRGYILEAEARGAAEQEEQGIEAAKDEGANYVLTSLALLFGRDGFEIRDGSETWEGDVNATLEGILKAGGLIDDEGDLLDLATLKDRFAEQRRKDAEGAEPVAYRWAYDVPKGRDSLWHFGGDLPEPRPERPEPKHVTPLYTRPANVAALEARVVELEGERVRAVSRLRSQIVGYRKTQHSRIAKSLARTLHVVYGETYRDSDFEHVAVVEDMLRARAETAESRIAEAVMTERERCASKLDEVAKHLAHPWGSHLTEEGIAVKEACTARVEQEAAAIREGGEHG